MYHAAMADSHRQWFMISTDSALCAVVPSKLLRSASEYSFDGGKISNNDQHTHTHTNNYQKKKKSNIVSTPIATSTSNYRQENPNLIVVTLHVVR